MFSVRRVLEGGTMTTGSVVERSRLEQLESVIERGLATFVEVGEALAEIRDSRLYLESHGSFEDYCRQRWGLGRSRAYQLIDAAAVSTIVDIPNEAQARELVPLLDQPAELAAALDDAQLNGPVTAATVREAVESRMGVHYSSETDEWATPQDLFDLLSAEFLFTLDVCATPENAKCGRFYTKDDDGLHQPWDGVCWMNPPYGQEIGRWVGKAWNASRGGATVVCLVPARVDTGWWWDYCRYGEVRFLRGRLKFGGGENAAPFPSAVVIFGRPAAVKWWEAWPV